MSLSTVVQARLSTNRLVQLTNPDGTGNTVNTTALDNAITDVEAMWPVYAQEAFDETDATHLAIGVRAVEGWLQLLATGEDDKWRAAEKAMQALAAVGPRARISPVSNAEATPTSERTSAGDTPRPHFDRARFRDVAPNAPTVGDGGG